MKCPKCPYEVEYLGVLLHHYWNTHDNPPYKSLYESLNKLDKKEIEK